ncbi:transient receptor potential cation channel subfamily A member 1-like isoform X2 [Dendronephthya gigantea]|uniref:transient receptor potential cation channel subfamily A member 1-like isoform X2 n=1 Tax=Dendronephthya gigantea TaxID=151771 RepID=UPI00106B699B|nr:transient receptor potential cation channel subfamily A member 1-like isoform X2 [Dendronephthya gigantea]
MEDSGSVPCNSDDGPLNAENKVNDNGNGNIDAGSTLDDAQITELCSTENTPLIDKDANEGSTLDSAQITEFCSTENTPLIDKDANEVDSGPLRVLEDYEFSNDSSDDSVESDDAGRDEFRQIVEQSLAKAILKKEKDFDSDVDALPKSRIGVGSYVHQRDFYEWVSPLSKTSIQCRIFQAVERNSLKCLDVLCEVYVKAVSGEYSLFHRFTFFVSGVQDERPKETALHVLATKTTSAKAILKVFEKRPKFLNDLSDFPDSYGSTPLLVAINYNNIEVAKRLIRTKSRVDKRNDDGESPILLAALNDYVDIIKEMLETYLESQERTELLEIMKSIDDKHHSILYPASQSGNSKVLNLIMKKTNWRKFLDQEQTVTEDWNEFVGNVCAAGCKKLAKECLKRDSSLLERGEEEKVTPLMRAAEANKLRIVRLIFEMQPSAELLHINDENNRNVFHYAVGNLDVLRYLVLQVLTFYDYCYATSIYDESGCTPLWLARNQKESLLLLINIAKFELFENYIINDVDIEILKRSLHMMKRQDPKGVTYLLHGYNPNNQPLLAAARNGNIKLMEFLLQEGADPLQIGDSYNTVVHLAVMSKKLEAVEYLFEQGKLLEIIDRTNNMELTAAGIAAEYGYAEILKYLLKKNAQIKSDGKKRKNILDYACDYDYRRVKELAIKEIVMFCVKDGNPKLLKELFEDSGHDPDDIMALLVYTAPDVAFLILDHCISRNVDTSLCYWFFPFKRNNHKKKLQALERMTESPNADRFLRHAVVVKLLNWLMYSSGIQKYFLLNFFLYTMFLITLTTYGAIQSGGLHRLKSPGMIALSVVILILSGFLLVKEISQMIAYGKEYMRDLENIFELTIFICAMIYVVPGGDKKTDGQIVVGAISIFLAWVNFSQFFRVLFNFGVYIFMAIKVFGTVCMVLPLVILLLVGFSLSFSLIMHQDAGFNDVPTSFLTTLVMMTGELDYRDTFLASGSLHALQKIFLVLFILMISIAIMNLFTGVAVGDVNEMLIKSKERRRINKAKLVIKLERGLSFYSSGNSATANMGELHVYRL